MSAVLHSHANTIDQLLRQAPAAAQPLLHALVAAQNRHELFAPDQHVPDQHVPDQHVPDQRVIVAVSGGADSVSLLHALHQFSHLWHLTLEVAHLDHALRPDSADDAAFVATLAQSLQLPFHHTRLSPGILDDDPQGLEATARLARYAFLRRVATSFDPPATIATAHHQDDQAETLLLHLVQGSGLPGLAGMAWVGDVPDGGQPRLRLVRPLLGVSRDEIHAYLHSYGLSWREDASNRDLAFARNQIRHQVLPQLAAINPNIHATLARTAHLLAAEAAHAERRDRAALAQMTHEYVPSTRLVLDLFHLAHCDQATQRGVLRQALLRLGVDVRSVGMAGIDVLLDQSSATNARGPHPLQAGWAWSIVYVAGSRHAMLALHRADALPITLTTPHFGAALPPPRALPSPRALPTVGTLTHANWSLHSTLLPKDALPANWRDLPWQLFADAEACGDLYLTTFHTGMSIAPLGMHGQHRAVGDIFTDHKIAPALRPGWPVIVNAAHEVVWLCGLTVADTVRMHPATRQVRHLHWQPETITP